MSDYDLFISYRHADAEYVEALFGALTPRGLRVWLDKSEIIDF